jgi:hypothetical protein
MAATKRRRSPMGKVRSTKAASSSSRRQDDSTENVHELVPRGLAGAFVSSKLHEKSVRQAGLKPPSDFEGEMPELPADIDAVDHSDLSNLIMEFQNALSTSLWQASMAYIEADIYEEIYEYLENKAILNSEQSNDAKRKAEARTDDTVVAFRNEHKKSYHNYVRFRDLARTIEGKVKVISRVGGFKDDEQDAGDLHGRGKPKISTRRRRSDS